MYALHTFGRPLEAQWGSDKFAALYVSACACSGAAVALLAVTGIPSLAVAGLGASGGVYCIAVASCLNMPSARVGIPLVPIEYSVPATDLPKYAAMFDSVGLLACALGALVQCHNVLSCSDAALSLAKVIAVDS
jgi:membrane associated rhomboid family serine protease